jgi:hypothetical protein
MSTRRSPRLAPVRIKGQGSRMAEKNPEREARLAAKLRENLKRRKAQARAQGEQHDYEPEADRGDAPALPKSPPAG